MNYTGLVEAVIALAVVLITGFLIPFLKSKVEIAKWEKWRNIARIAVQAAEQIFMGEGRGTEKKEYVLNYLSEKLKVDKETLENLIESGVFEINNAIFED
jgi:LL-H family phage holin